MPQERYRTAIRTEFEAGPVRARGEIENVARGGLFVGTAFIPEEGERVQLRFHAPDGARIDLSGIVWWTTLDRQVNGHTPGFGVRLLNACDAYQLFVNGLGA